VTTAQAQRQADRETPVASLQEKTTFCAGAFQPRVCRIDY
jgi:hypothetical protein